MIPKIVKTENLPSAVTMNQATFLVASVSGHALGGFLIALISIKFTLVVIISSMIIASFSSGHLTNKRLALRKQTTQKSGKVLKKVLLLLLKLKKFLVLRCWICLPYFLVVQSR